jgi:5-methylcytosine-specific restriction endonuclease McrA
MAETDEQTFTRDGFKCVYRGFDGRTFNGWAFLQVDHFKPKSRFGSDEPENRVTACVVCNNMKGGAEFATLEEARAAIQLWWAQMREYWKKNVKPLVPPSPEDSMYERPTRKINFGD